MAKNLAKLLAVCAGLLASALLALPMPLPHELSERTDLQLSGVAWSPAWSRYLLVSGEVTEAGSKHEPVLLTLSESGQLDSKPIRIEGIAELNDAQSVTPGPPGTVFLCTSHSANKTGHLPEGRRRLLFVALSSERTAKLLGQLDLSVARDAQGQPPWGAGTLDIEGAAFREGALYLGLKSPLGTDGSATILRLPDAVAVVQSGVLQRDALSVWSRTRLCVPHDGSSICEGISDLAFLPDGSLLVTGNAPKGMPADGGGSLWKLSAPSTPATLLKRFEGLKPEGVALAPDHTAAVVVFDTDGRPPIWIQCPL